MAMDNLIKPFPPFDPKALTTRVHEHPHLLEEVHRLRSGVDATFDFDKVIGRSTGLVHVMELAARVAQTDATVLIHGETGTGKELLAKAIHFRSHRRDRPFVLVNCGAIARELLESELFGHVKGAFTGAFNHKKGKVEPADGGTLFLDEIGEMPLDLQVRVLRLIQDHEIDKVGDTKSIHVDVRIIAATHRNLEALVESGNFREDLYYRLVVVPIEIPPLRERPEDVPEFVHEFFTRSIHSHGRENLKLPPELVSCFSRYRWPGNVRQLQNVIERMVVLCPGEEITMSDLPDFLRDPPADAIESWTAPGNLTLEAVEKEMVMQALRASNWNQTRAAEQLGVTRKILMTRMAKYGIRRHGPELSEPESA
jgi:transcriptional regulator with PAS, ATPase and Fis domain